MQLTETFSRNKVSSGCKRCGLYINRAASSERVKRSFPCACVSFGGRIAGLVSSKLGAVPPVLRQNMRWERWIILSWTSTGKFLCNLETVGNFDGRVHDGCIIRRWYSFIFIVYIFMTRIFSNNTEVCNTWISPRIPHFCFLNSMLTLMLKDDQSLAVTSGNRTDFVRLANVLQPVC